MQKRCWPVPQSIVGRALGKESKPSSATGAVLLGSEAEDTTSKVLTLLEEPHSPH